MRAEKKDRAGARNSGGNREERDGGDAVKDVKEKEGERKRKGRKGGFRQEGGIVEGVEKSTRGVLFS